MPRLAEAGGTVDVQADEALPGVDGGTRVNTHADTDRLSLGPGSRKQSALGVRCGLDRIVRRLEDRERLVRTTLDLAAAVFGDGPPKDGP